MDINSLLTAEREVYLTSQDFEGRAYWFRHIRQLHRLKLPLTNPYPEHAFAHACIKRAIRLILELTETHGTITEETFSDALGGAIPEVIWPYPSRR